MGTNTELSGENPARRGEAGLSLVLFGEPRLDYQGQTVDVARRKALGLLAYLAVSKWPQGRDVLCALLWPEQDHDRARAALRSTLSVLATLVPVDWLDKSSGALALNRDVIAVDAAAFLDLIAGSRSHNHPPGKVCEECEPLLSRA